MTLSRIFFVATIMLFGAIGVAAYVKQSKSKKAQVVPNQPIEVNLQAANGLAKAERFIPMQAEANSVINKPIVPKQEGALDDRVQNPLVAEDFPDVDRVNLLFQKDSPLPIVQTIPYKSRVAWKSGRSAWLVDYASHYKTSLHFIARSLNGRPDYAPKPASEGERFTILNPNVNFNFHAVIDIARCKLWLYAVMPDVQERILLKTYRVGLGRLDTQKTSGSLTPIGKYSLGSRIAIFQPKMMGNHKGKRVELLTVFGTRWIPFEKEIEGCSEQAKGFGIHGTPWQLNSDGKLVDNADSIGKYESDGCIRLRQPDIEELFAIISTHATIVEIVTDFSKTKLPGKEKIY